MGPPGNRRQLTGRPVIDASRNAEAHRGEGDLLRDDGKDGPGIEPA
jgi:hypothetical protein